MQLCTRPGLIRPKKPSICFKHHSEIVINRRPFGCSTLQLGGAMGRRRTWGGRNVSLQAVREVPASTQASQPVPSSSPVDPEANRVKDWLKGATVVITGATGFIGRALLEKILRLQPEVAEVVLLVQPNADTPTAAAALRRVLCPSLWGPLAEALGGEDALRELVSRRLSVLAADITHPMLGMEEETYTDLQAKATLVLHAAANTRLDESYDAALRANTLGAEEVALFAAGCPNLQSFVHFSTAFASGLRTGLIREEPAEFGRSVAAELAASNPHARAHDSLDVAGEIEVALAFAQAADADADPRCALPCGGPVAFAPSYRPRASRVAAADPSFASNGSGSGSDWGSSSNGNGNGSGHSLGGSMESVGGAAPSSSHSTSLASTASTDEGAAAKARQQQLLQRSQTHHHKEGPGDSPADNANGANGCSRAADVEAALRRKGMEHALAHGWQDTYSFTKALGEMLVTRVAREEGLRTVIMRPAVVLSPAAEPAPGWHDGCTGRMVDPLIVAYARGQLPGFPFAEDGVFDVVPLDHVVNATLAAAWASAAGATPDLVSVYHLASSHANPLHNRLLADTLTDHFERMPLALHRHHQHQQHSIHDLLQPHQHPKEAAAAAPTTKEANSKLPTPPPAPFVLYKDESAFAQALAAALPAGPTRGARSAQLLHLASLFIPYTCQRGRYETRATAALYAGLTPAERGTLPFDVAELDWASYLGDVHIAGLRKYVLGQPVTLPVPPRKRRVAGGGRKAGAAAAPCDYGLDAYLHHGVPHDADLEAVQRALEVARLAAVSSLSPSLSTTSSSAASADDDATSTTNGTTARSAALAAGDPRASTMHASSNGSSSSNNGRQANNIVQMPARVVPSGPAPSATPALVTAGAASAGPKPAPGYVHGMWSEAEHAGSEEL